ncbi:MAG TPA: hypothetical protein VIF35_10055 [Streptosporangiaceae bacterium]
MPGTTSAAAASLGMARDAPPSARPGQSVAADGLLLGLGAG